MRPGAVLVTRPQPGADATAARLVRMGLHPIVAPMLLMRRLEPELPDPAALQAVLITSANALPGLPEGYRELPLLAVGSATAAAARTAGFVHALSAGGDACDLLALVRARCAPAQAPLLLASGERQGAELTAALQRHGFKVWHAFVYAADPVRRLAADMVAAWNGGTMSAALFFSFETAQVLVRLIEDAGLAEGARALDALAIAKSASAALTPLPWRRVRVAVRPDQDAMLALLK